MGRKITLMIEYKLTIYFESVYDCSTADSINNWFRSISTNNAVICNFFVNSYLVVDVMFFLIKNNKNIWILVCWIFKTSILKTRSFVLL